MRTIKEITQESTHCWECKGKPDYAYLNNLTGQVLSVICKPCKDLTESLIRSMFKCTDSHCKSCDRSNDHGK